MLTYGCFLSEQATDNGALTSMESLCAGADDLPMFGSDQLWQLGDDYFNSSDGGIDLSSIVFDTHLDFIEAELPDPSLDSIHEALPLSPYNENGTFSQSLLQSGPEVPMCTWLPLDHNSGELVGSSPPRRRPPVPCTIVGPSCFFSGISSERMGDGIHHRKIEPFAIPRRQRSQEENKEHRLTDFGRKPYPESIAQVKEMIYRAAVMRPVNLGRETLEEKPGRRNVRISSNPQTMAARQRRDRVSRRLRVLQRLVPGGSKMDTATMLEEAASFIKYLKSQLSDDAESVSYLNRTQIKL